MKRSSDRGGQTIVEAMVAVSLLVIGFLGMITLINRSIGLNRVVADNYTATYLAAEGIEVVKNMVDSNFLQNTWFQHFDTMGCISISGCSWEVQYDTSWEPGHTPAQYSSRPLYFNTTTGLYAYAPFGDRTSFTRRVVVTFRGPENNEMIVHSIVEWRTRGGSLSSLDLEDHFYNWYNP